MILNKKIISEEEVTLYGIDHKKITYDDGEVILKSYDEDSKMWFICRFKEISKAEIDEIINSLCEISKNALMGTIFN